ncbi:MAG: DUF5996 family protein [Dokdonella sp.]|uniref:DUF5996 family protein n=1 Tax=Dokdonella sp. TaxID=2291710 RepID=UPI003267DA7B
MTETQRDRWPALPLDEWRDTCETLQLWTQIVGKTRLAFAPMQNHWWQIALYVTPRGLTTSAMPCANGSFSVEFDFLEHRLLIQVSDGATRGVALEPCSVADFFARYLAALLELGIAPGIRPVPVELATVIPFARDRKHASYDPDAVQRWWRILLQTERVMQRFRGRFVGKQSPAHFFWGSFDLATTRFSGRRAPRHPGGVPHCPDDVMVEAYSHECSSCGFWPGGGPVEEPAFYAYAYPEPPGYASYPVRPAAAAYNAQMHEFVLPYSAIRSAADPDSTLLQFLQSTYEAAAELGLWDRVALERIAQEWP